MDGPVPAIAFILLLGLIATSVSTVVFVAISLIRRFTTKTPTFLAATNTVFITLLTILSFFVSHTGIGDGPFLILLGILILSILACIQISRHTDVDW